MAKKTTSGFEDSGDGEDVPPGDVAARQRAELHKAIWGIANNLRGSVDGWEFKQYILGFLFYRFISENLVEYLNDHQHRAGQSDFDYSKLADNQAEFGREETILQKGFFILPSHLFSNIALKARSDENLNMTLESIFKAIEGSALGHPSEKDLKGLFDDLDVNATRLGNTVAQRNEKLVKIVESIAAIDFENAFQGNKIDAFGDAYEYLMTMYASGAGKSGGEFFTPQTVSELLARITLIGKTEVNKVYDPACGSGSLLLQYAKVLGKDKVREGFYGQEINLTTYNLARINMFLHDINYEKFDIALGDTLRDPQHWDDEPFEAIVSNPPYSIEWAGDSDPLLINDERYAPAGVLAPKKKADLAFTMHMLHGLAVNGTAAIVQFPGVMYRDGAEQKIRRYLVENNFVDAIIQLPIQLFYGTGISTCIMVLKKSKNDNKVMFVDASKLFVRSGTQNKLDNSHISQIVESLTNRDDVSHFSRLVHFDEIAARKFNLSVSTYVDAEDTREIIDIKTLNSEIVRLVARQSELRTQVDKIVADFEAGSQ
jgi:type I restriction enzyme M protein